MPKLLASYFTLAGDVQVLTGNMVSPIDLRDRVEAAARAGYIGIGLGLRDLVHNIDRYGYGGIRRMLSDNRIDYLELEALLDWFADGERRAASDADRRTLLTAAEKVGAFQVKIAGDITGTQWPLDRMIESFARLCEDAAEAGTQISLEIFPASNVRDLPTAIAIAVGAGAPNGGLLLDIWHLTRGGIPYEDIATIPPSYIKHIELDDAMKDRVGTIMDDTTLRRRLPGEGDFDIPHFIECVRRTGYDGLYGVEILSDEQRRRPVDEAARLSFEATMHQFASQAVETSSGRHAPGREKTEPEVVR